MAYSLALNQNNADLFCWYNRIVSWKLGVISIVDTGVNCYLNLGSQLLKFGTESFLTPNIDINPHWNTIKICTTRSINCCITSTRFVEGKLFGMLCIIFIFCTTTMPQIICKYHEELSALHEYVYVATLAIKRDGISRVVFIFSMTPTVLQYEINTEDLCQCIHTL